MREHERTLVTGLVLFLLILWLGFLIHVNRDFAGSGLGLLLGVLALILLLVPGAYSLVKRVPKIKSAVAKRVSMRTFLTWHIYASILGAILGIIHSGHHFESRIGILLISITLLVILSGFVGRYLMVQVDREIKEKFALLDRASIQYARIAQQIRERPNVASDVALHQSFLSRLWTPLRLSREGGDDSAIALEWRAVRLAESMADLEYAAKTHEFFKLWFARWLRFHIALSVFLYGVLAFHVGGEFALGLRWPS